VLTVLPGCHFGGQLTHHSAGAAFSGAWARFQILLFYQNSQPHKRGRPASRLLLLIGFNDVIERCLWAPNQRPWHLSRSRSLPKNHLPLIAAALGDRKRTSIWTRYIVQ
jgi:hypothetical protein